MHVTAIKTPRLFVNDNLLGVISTTIPQSALSERSVLVVTSKVVALWEGAVAEIPRTKEEKHKLIHSESQLYTKPTSSKYDLMLTVRDDVLGVNAGIDESNVAEGFVLLPENSYQSAAHIWQFLRKQYGLREVGVIITDSVSMPLRWGVVGRSLGHCGFKAIKSRIGEKDLFDREITMTQMAVSQALATAAVFEMGEVAESTPLCILTEIPHIEFQDAPPSKEEIDTYKIALEDDVYAPLLMNARWQKGQKV